MINLLIIKFLTILYEMTSSA